MFRILNVSQLINKAVLKVKFNFFFRKFLRKHIVEILFESSYDIVNKDGRRSKKDRDWIKIMKLTPSLGCRRWNINKESK